VNCSLALITFPAALIVNCTEKVYVPALLGRPPIQTPPTRVPAGSPLEVVRSFLVCSIPAGKGNFNLNGCPTFTVPSKIGSAGLTDDVVSDAASLELTMTVTDEVMLLVPSETFTVATYLPAAE
jgi:hypothetical protein